MSDFTSALYLGMHHSSQELTGWENLTTGSPAVLGTPPVYDRLAQSLARLQGCEHGVLGRSTWHLLWDLINMCSQAKTSFYLDAGTYPIAQWGAERAACRGRPLLRFSHHDADALQRLMQRDAQRRRRPIVIADGWCVRCGHLAPLDAYLACARRYGGRLIVDDTQALGILGERIEDSDAPYGTGGGGSLRWLGIEDPHVVVVASLAKAFGAPLAVLSSGSRFVRRFIAASETRVHTSPPSMADVRAAQHALAESASRGPLLRRRLAQLVCRFRHGLARLGLSAKNSLFPVQVFQPPPGVNVGAMHRRLASQGVQLLRLRQEPPHEEELAAVIRADHHPRDIDGALRALALCLHRPFTRRQIEESFHGMPL